MSDSLGNRLQQAHDLGVEGPMPEGSMTEGLDMASAGSIEKHLAHLAVQSAATGQAATEWRASTQADIEGATPAVIAQAEKFMRSAGVWPWQD